MVLRALEIMAHFPAHVGHRESGHRAEDPALRGRYLLQVRGSVQEADSTVDQHALETEPRAVQERQPVRRVGGREASEGRSRGPRLMGGQRERVRGQLRELLYSIPMALCEEIASAATELADRLPD